MIADLHKIKRFTLHMDEITVVAIGKGVAHRFNQVIALYNVLDRISLPSDKVIISDEQLNLER
ncbi:hypothetical protein ES703_51428 [subsurface metagenome]